MKARFASICGRCSKPVSTGDEIARTGLGAAWVHRDCLTGATSSAKTTTGATEADKLRAQVERLDRLNREKLATINQLRDTLRAANYAASKWVLHSCGSTASATTTIADDRLGKVLRLAMRAGTDGEALAAISRARDIHEKGSR